MTTASLMHAGFPVIDPALLRRVTVVARRAGAIAALAVQGAAFAATLWFFVASVMVLG